MNSASKVVFGTGLLFLAVGCGKINDSMNAVQSMSGTTATMSATTQDMAATTKGMSKTTEGLAEQTTQMNKKTEVMVDAIHLQTLGMGWDQILYPKNTVYVTLDSVVPSSMMIPGEIFAKKATQEEIVKLVKILVLENGTGQPDGDLATKDGFPAEELERLDLEKWRKFIAMEVIAGLAPQSTIEDMVKVQITDGGPYIAEARSVLYMRHDFIKKYILEDVIMNETFETPGVFYDALGYIDNLKYIESLPYAKDLQVQLSGFANDKNLSKNKTYKLTDDDVKKDFYPKLLTHLNQLSPAFVPQKDKLKALILKSAQS